MNLLTTDPAPHPERLPERSEGRRRRTSGGRLVGRHGPRAPVAELRPGARTLAFALRLYQLAVSPLLGSTCRFAPSCSQYTREAILRHGAWRGLGYGLRRVARCHPLHPGGWDPVP